MHNFRLCCYQFLFHQGHTCLSMTVYLITGNKSWDNITVSLFLTYGDYCTGKFLLPEKWVQQEGIISRSTQKITVILEPCAAECHFKRYRLPFAFKFTSPHTSECTIVWNNQIKSVPELSSLWKNSDYFPTLHYQISFYNRDDVYLPCGTK